MCLVLCTCVCVRVVALINNAAAREAEREVASSSIQMTQRDSRQQKADGGEIKSARTLQQERSKVGENGEAGSRGSSAADGHWNTKLSST